MARTTPFYKTTIGKKLMMAVTGLGLVGFNLVHMLGNLQIFLGPDAINAYAAFLKSSMEVLWVARSGLIAFFVIHIVTAFQLRQRNADARPEKYVFESTVQATTASRTMALTGSLLAIYVVGHLAHFTLGIITPEYHNIVDAHGRHDVYRMVVKSFEDPLIATLYIFGMIAVGFHLSHGIGSIFQTLGLNSRASRKFWKFASPATAIVLVLGYVSIPIAVQLGILQ